MITVNTKCPFCHKQHKVNVPRADYDAWRLGTQLAQDAMPTLSIDDRELLITGICNDCFPKEEADTA